MDLIFNQNKYMKKFISFLFLILFVNLSCCQSKSENNKFYKVEYDAIESKPFLLDFENLFSKNQIDSLLKITKEFENKTTAEICIITLDNEIENYEKLKTQSLFLANYLGVGKKEKFNGILICISKKARLIRIENGDGISNLLSDLETENIVLKDFVTEFKNSNYFDGTLKGLNNIIEILSTRIVNADDKNKSIITELLKIKSEEKFISGSCGINNYLGCKSEEAEEYSFSINLSIDLIILELKKYSSQNNIDKLILDEEARAKDINFIFDGQKAEYDMISKYFERIKSIAKI